ncbi:TonB family protein [Stenotrophomonas sp. MMGLT7]|uniref:TonB family protein n=1 Tax=Stenotrophomonas sp. MMGLT7 TaxID=2901227 RepID=UPI001E2F9C1C|nr:TonB family protein [Stenotrophomonas sp. MMGLT7]
MRGRKALQWMTLLLAGFAGLASAAAVGPGAVRKQVESSMLLRGSIDLDRTGSVTEVALEQEDKLPQGVVDFVRGSVAQWKFEPVVRDGKPVLARAPVSLRVVAKKRDDGNYQVAIRHADFSVPAKDEDGESVTSKSMNPPRYPEAAYRSGFKGTVYLILKVGRDGRVEDVVAEQVNLRVIASENQMRIGRDLLARASVAAARRWSFVPPVRGDAANEPYWTVRVPVNYAFHGDPESDAYGKWSAYVPGPRQPVPWRAQQDAPGFSPDTLAQAGGVYMAGAGNGPRLLTPLDGG